MARNTSPTQHERKTLSKPVTPRAKRTGITIKPNASGLPALLKAIEVHALDTFGSREKANHWMNRPNALFEGKTPLQLIETDPQSVEAELGRIDHGVYV
jgi:putative toxin-antitoxin system antitoxin component (TIGR02293 family)